MGIKTLNQSEFLYKNQRNVLCLGLFLYICSRNLDKIRIIMEATIINTNVNVITTVNAVVVKETTYQKLKRLSKKYNLQTNDPKFARI